MLHQIDAKNLGPRGEAMAKAVGTCVHCGFCLPACPTYQVLESEMDSPRGRIILMKSVLEGELSSQKAAVHIDRCLGCLACVTHCPSGVPYGDLISSYRSHRNASQGSTWSFRDWIIRQTLPYPSRFRWALRLGRFGKLFSSLMPPQLRPMLDLVPKQLPKSHPIPPVVAAEKKRVGRVALVTGCAQQVLAPDINWAAVRVLSRNGIEVVVPRHQTCCGALDWHTGHSKSATKLAQGLIESIPKDVDCVITTAAGCGSAIHEYPLLFAGHSFQEIANEFAKKTLDISVYLEGRQLEPFPPLSKSLKIAYQDACHLAHAQSVRQPPRQLLSQIEGLTIAELASPDTCCGSAGTYNIDQPEIAGQLGERKANEVIATGAKFVVTGNIGCLIQLEKHLGILGAPVTVLHTVQILDRAYRRVLN